jgi:hypothetical protein
MDAVLEADLERVRATQATVYWTRDNGGHAFRVTVRGDGVTARDLATLVDTEVVGRVWVGLSPVTPMTQFSGGYGSQYDGNSILVETSDRECCFIGTCIRRFETAGPIVRFVSEVGNNCVPYPYAVDVSGRCYLLIEDVVLDEAPEDPYDVYYTRDQQFERVLGVHGFVDSANPTVVYRPTLQMDPAGHYDRAYAAGLESVTVTGARVSVPRDVYIHMMLCIARVLGVRAIKFIE